MENSDRTFFLRVRDDGVGMPDEQVERLNAQFESGKDAGMTQQYGGIALRHVNSRIRLTVSSTHLDVYKRQAST